MTEQPEHERAPRPGARHTRGRCYAGIGSRRTPPVMLAVCEQIVRALAECGWRLRSGHAPGAD